MVRKQFSPAEIEEKRLKDNKRHSERYHQRILEMAPDELKQFRLREKEKRSRFLKKRTAEEKAKANEKAKNHMRNLRATWTPERKLAEKEWHKQWARKMSPERLEKERTRGRMNRRLLKEKVIRHYSNGEMRCMCPTCEVPGGAKDLDALTIDHIYGGGKQHVKTLRANGVTCRFNTWLIKNNFPKDGYQVLCWNCNNRKRKVNHEDHYAVKGVRGTQHLPKGENHYV